jgi:hypothetical protein
MITVMTGCVKPKAIPSKSSTFSQIDNECAFSRGNFSYGYVDIDFKCHEISADQFLALLERKIAPERFDPKPLVIFGKKSLADTRYTIVRPQYNYVYNPLHFGLLQDLFSFSGELIINYLTPIDNETVGLKIDGVDFIIPIVEKNFLSSFEKSFTYPKNEANLRSDSQKIREIVRAYTNGDFQYWPFKSKLNQFMANERKKYLYRSLGKLLDDNSSLEELKSLDIKCQTCKQSSLVIPTLLLYKTSDFSKKCKNHVDYYRQLGHKRISIVPQIPFSGSIEDGVIESSYGEFIRYETIGAVTAEELDNCLTYIARSSISINYVPHLESIRTITGTDELIWRYNMVTPLSHIKDKENQDIYFEMAFRPIIDFLNKNSDKDIGITRITVSSETDPAFLYFPEASRYIIDKLVKELKIPRNRYEIVWNSNGDFIHKTSDENLKAYSINCQLLEDIIENIDRIAPSMYENYNHIKPYGLTEKPDFAVTRDYFLQKELKERLIFNIINQCAISSDDKQVLKDRLSSLIDDKFKRNFSFGELSLATDDKGRGRYYADFLAQMSEQSSGDATIWTDNNPEWDPYTAKSTKNNILKFISCDNSVPDIAILSANIKVENKGFLEAHVAASGKFQQTLLLQLIDKNRAVMGEWLEVVNPGKIDKIISMPYENILNSGEYSLEASLLVNKDAKDLKIAFDSQPVHAMVYAINNLSTSDVVSNSTTVKVRFDYSAYSDVVAYIAIKDDKFNIFSYKKVSLNMGENKEAKEELSFFKKPSHGVYNIEVKLSKGTDSIEDQVAFSSKKIDILEFEISSISITSYNPSAQKLALNFSYQAETDCDAYVAIKDSSWKTLVKSKVAVDSKKNEEEVILEILDPLPIKDKILEIRLVPRDAAEEDYLTYKSIKI